MFLESFAVEIYGWEGYGLDHVTKFKYNNRCARFTEVESIGIRRLRTWNKNELIFSSTFLDGFTKFVRIDALQEVLECFQ